MEREKLHKFEVGIVVIAAILLFVSIFSLVSDKIAFINDKDGLTISSVWDGKLNGEYITSDSTARYLITNDSLFVDDMNSGCGIEQFSTKTIESVSDTKVRFAGINQRGEEVGITMYRPMNIDCHWEYGIKYDDGYGMVELVRVERKRP